MPVGHVGTAAPDAAPAMGAGLIAAVRAAITTSFRGTTVLWALRRLGGDVLTSLAAGGFGHSRFGRLGQLH